MNSTKEEDISSEAIIISQTRVWLFGDSIDGIVIMFPIYLFGTVMNSFQVDLNSLRQNWHAFFYKKIFCLGIFEPPDTILTKLIFYNMLLKSTLDFQAPLNFST